ncbi:hypothetical protein [Agrobacterium sp. CG674]
MAGPWIIDGEDGEIIETEEECDDINEAAMNLKVAELEAKYDLPAQFVGGDNQ